MKALTKILFLLSVTLVTVSCGEKLGQINVEGGNPPQFVFYGEGIRDLYVYRVPRKYLNKQIPLEVVSKVNQDTQWYIEGLHDAHVPIIYSSVPDGMKEIAPAKPLVEGEIYLVHSWVATTDTGFYTGQYFRIQNGRTVEVHERVDEKTLNP